MRLVVDHNVAVGMLMVELASGPPGEAPSVMLQRRLGEPTRQDVELGMTGYALSDERGATAYDCVVRCELNAGSLYLELSDVAVGKGFERHIEFTLDPAQGFADVLAPLLPRIFGTSSAPS